MSLASLDYDYYEHVEHKVICVSKDVVCSVTREACADFVQLQRNSSHSIIDYMIDLVMSL